MNQERLILRSFTLTDDGTPLVTCRDCMTDFDVSLTYRDAWTHLKLRHQVHGESGYYGARADSPIAFRLLQRS